MRNSLIVLLFSLSLSSSGATYYIATNGKDSNPGTITQPWATWQYGFNHISPGDILYISGGTYTPTEITTTSSRHCAVIVNGKKGTANSPYQVFAYPGETPILDCRNITGTSYERAGILILDSSYWHLKGLTVTRVDQPTSGDIGGEGISIWGISSATHNTIENCVAHHNGGPGMGTRQYVNETLFLNCDVYSNWDAYSSMPGGDADGFDIGYSYNDAIVRLTGCRAWLNGDDGFDMYEGSGYSGIYYLTDCWAWHNGYRPDGVSKGGDGCGFKLGTGESSSDVVRRYLYNCIAYDNMTWGITQNIGHLKSNIYNCVAYSNKTRGYDFQWNNIADILRNNISFSNGSSDIFQSNQTRDHNSWDSGVTVTNADFLSTDGTELTSSRKADGSLPDINFLHLVSGSDLIDAGVDIGTTYSGNAPDLGPFELQTGTPTAPPVYSSSAIENATPSLLEMNYNLTLANVVPAASCFYVLVNSTSRSVNSVAVSGKKVQLTIASPIIYGDVVTISYTKPSDNPLQTSYGAEAVSISAQAVSNKVNGISPTYVSSVIVNATPAVLEMTYDMTLASIVPATSAFKVLVNSSSRSVSSVAVSGTKVLLTLSTPIVYGDVVSVSYTKPSSKPLQSLTGVQVASLSAQKVTNNVNSKAPVYVRSVIATATPAVLEMSYDMTLANTVPAASAFRVLVNSSSRSVSSVAISGTKVLLNLSSPVVSGDVVTVSYTKPTSNPIQSSTGAQSASLTAQNVTNNVTAAIPVYVSSVIANATPAVLEMTYDMTLANKVPAGSAFKVLVNSSSVSLSSVAVSGTKVKLTLSNSVVYGDNVTISYTKPSVNPLQSSTGAQATTLSSQKVTNNVTSKAPGYVSSEIKNDAPAVLEMTYDLALANIVPAVSTFKVVVNSSSRSVSAVAVSGSIVKLTLSTPIVYGNTVTVSYTKPTVNPLQSSTGALAATISSQKVTNNVNAPIPVYVSSAIPNTAPSVIEMTYNMNLANIVPAASAFKVLVNSTSTSLSSVVISGSTVKLTLSSSVVYGDIITVSYTKPTVNPLQSSAGATAATLSAQTVTNNINAPAPTYISSIIENATPSVLEMTYNMTLANIVPAISAFKVLVNSSSRAVSSVAVSGTKVVLTLSSPVAYGNAVTVSYTKPSTKPLQDLTGVQAATISDQKVTNNIVSLTNSGPTVSITDPSDNSSFTAPANITITANASDAEGSVILVEFYNGTTRLGSKSAAPYSFTLDNVGQGTYSLTAVAIDNEGATTTSSEVFVAVFDDTPPPTDNQLPTVTISSPGKGNKFENPSDIEIEVIASDPDGTISKVELFNGSEKLVELTSAPYSYTWKGVSAGIYHLKAIATDNSNETTTSAPVEFTVGDRPKYDANSEVINLYPNPNSGHFTIDFLVPLENPKNEIVISDLGGNQVYRETISAEETTKQFDLPNVRSGIYIMTVISNEIFVTKKILIK
jgi:uncharacterized repeat protein (TIGR02059 family)